MKGKGKGKEGNEREKGRKGDGGIKGKEGKEREKGKRERECIDRNKIFYDSGLRYGERRAGKNQ